MTAARCSSRYVQLCAVWHCADDLIILFYLFTNVFAVFWFDINKKKAATKRQRQCLILFFHLNDKGILKARILYLFEIRLGIGAYRKSSHLNAVEDVRLRRRL